MIDYRYAVVRVVPRAERDESLNVGVIVYCPQQGAIAVRVSADLQFLTAVDPAIDLDAVRRGLRAVELICAGDPEGGPAAGERAGSRFGHLTAPRSTIVRCSVTHGGVAESVQSALDGLYRRLVAR